MVKAKKAPEVEMELVKVVEEEEQSVYEEEE